MRPTGWRSLAFAAAVLLSEPSGAAMLQIYLTDANTNPPFPNGNDYLQLTIWDGTDAAGQQISTGSGTYTATASDVVFEIAPAAGLTSFEGSKFGLDEFAFNTKIKPLSTYASGNFVLPSGWSVKMGKNADGYGMFNLLPTGSGANTAANPLWFAITGISGDSISTYEVPSTNNAGQGNQYLRSGLSRHHQLLVRRYPGAAARGGLAAALGSRRDRTQLSQPARPPAPGLSRARRTGISASSPAPGVAGRAWRRVVTRLFVSDSSAEGLSRSVPSCAPRSASSCCGIRSA